MAAKTAKHGLGSGLGNLFGAETVAAMQQDETEKKETPGGDSTKQLLLTHIERNPDQPRKVFAQDALNELADSIRQHGVVTPITVRQGKKEGYYQIIAGERRWRAARLAGLKKIPAMVLEADEANMTELALIENLQRQDLNPIEEAEGYERLIQSFGMTQEQVAQQVAKSRPAVANALRLLALPEEARQMVASGKLSGGHARAVLSVSDESKRMAAAQQMAKMTVRQAEALARKLNKKPKKTKEKPAFEVNYLTEMEKALEAQLGRKVSITQAKGKAHGSLSIEYYDAADLERLLEALGSLRA